MTTLDVAHIREQGVDLIVIPLDDSFGRKTNAEQNRACTELQIRARSAGLAGTVVPVWEDCGRMAFLAPHNFAPFFRSIGLSYVFSRINKTLSFN